MRILIVVLFAFSAVFISPLGAAAQTRSIVTGTVKDSTGAVLPGVTITVAGPTLLGGPQTAVTNAEGVYRLPELAPGSYDVTAELVGFQTVNRLAVQVPFAVTLTVDFTFAVGTLAETLVVTGTAVGVDVKTTIAAPIMAKELIENIPMAVDERRVVNL